MSGQQIGYGKKRILRTNDVISILNPEYKLFVFQDLKADLSHDLPKMITGKYYVGQELGSGACGIVRLVYDVGTGNQFAMKQVVKNKLEDPGQKILNDPERIMNEVSIMKSLEHVSVGSRIWPIIRYLGFVAIILLPPLSNSQFSDFVQNWFWQVHQFSSYF